MKRFLGSRTRRAAAMGAALLGAGPGARAQFADPAPPVVAAPAPAPARDWQANPEATFHAPPAPMPAGATTGDWPCFLGPSHDMRSPETRLRRDLPAGGPPLVWEMRRGDGYAAPAIAGERLILFHRVDDRAVVECLNAADGRRAWQYGSPTSYRDRYGYNHGPRCSPVVAADRVFTYGADGHLQCLSLQTGQLLWQRDLLKEFGLKQNFFGVGATPLAEGSNLIVNVGAPGGPCVAAFDLRTGRMAWGAGREWGPSYATPVPATVDGRRRVFVFAGGESDPATGGLLWLDPADGKVGGAFPWRGRRYESVNASAPVVLGDRVFVSECYGAGGVLLAVPPEGPAQPVWTNRDLGTHFMTAIPRDGYLYGVDGHGPGDAYLACVELKSGRTMWRTQPTWTETVQTAAGPREIKCDTYRCSLLAVDGRCLCLGEQGHLLWLDLSPTGYVERARTRLFLAADTWTPPVVSRGLLYVCQNKRDPLSGVPPRLLCYDLRESADVQAPSAAASK